MCWRRGLPSAGVQGNSDTALKAASMFSSGSASPPAAVQVPFTSFLAMCNVRILLCVPHLCARSWTVDNVQLPALHAFQDDCTTSSCLMFPFFALCC